MLYTCVENSEGDFPRSYIYKSSDNGNRWSEVFRAHLLAAVRTRETDPQVVYAGLDGAAQGGSVGLYKSTNGGASWTPLTNGIDRPVIGTIAISAQNPDLLLAGAGRRTSVGKLYRSTDGGASWANVLPLLTPDVARVEDIAISPQDDGRVLFCASDGPAGHYGIFLSTDGGQEWTQTWSAGFVYSLAFAPDGQVVYAGADVNKVLKSTDGGQNWQVAATLPGQPWHSIHSVVVHPLDPTRVYLSRHRSGVWYSSDGGHNWVPRNNGLWLTDMWLTRLLVNQQDPECLFAGEYDAGLYRTADGGLNWKQASDWHPVLRLRNVVAQEQTGHIAVQAHTGPVCVSSNKGDDWEMTTRSFFMAARGALVQARPGVLLVSHPCLPSTDGEIERETADDDALHESFIARSTDHGYTWTVRYHGADVLVYDLATAPGDRTRAYAVAALELPGGYSFVLRSTDEGVSWDVAASGLSWRLRCVTVSHSDPDLLFLGCSDGSFLVSGDGGYNVVLVGELPDAVSCLVVDPGNDSVIYAGTPVGVYKSDDRGVNWQAANSGIEHLSVRALAVDPLDPRRLWVSTWGVNGANSVYHVCQSFDGAQSWLAARDGIPAATSVEGFHISQDDRRIYAATSAGVYLRDLGLIAAGSPEATHPNWGRNLVRIPNTQQYYAVYQDNGSIYYVSTPDRGATWTEPELVGHGLDPALVVNRSLVGAGQTPWVVYVTGDGAIERAIRQGPGLWSHALVFSQPGMSAGAPSLAAGITPDVVGPLAHVAYPVYIGEPPAQCYVYCNTFTEYAVSAPYELDNAPENALRSPSVAVTPGDIIHVAWDRSEQIVYREHRDGLWSEIYPISRPVWPPSEPASNPALEAYGDYIYCVWRGPNGQGQFPGDIWQSKRWLWNEPWDWFDPENQSLTPG
ncbi:MAG: hypothetical protein R6X12_06160 [bacterium]